MTQQKHFKALVRARMARTGERYATARRHLATRADLTRLDDAATIEAHAKHAIAVAFSPSGDALLSGGFGGEARIWSPIDATAVGDLVGHTGSVNGFAFVRDGTRVVTVSSDRTVRVWDLAARSELVSFRAHGRGAVAVDVAADGSIVTGGYDGTVRRWATDGTELGRTKLGARAVAVAAHPTEAWVAASSAEASVHLLDDAGRTVRTLDAPEVVSSLRWSADGASLVVGTCGGVRIWATGTWEPVRTIALDADAAVVPVAASPDGTLLAAGWPRHVGVWRADAEDDVPAVTVDGLPKGVYGLAFSPDGSRLAQCGADGVVRIWSIRRRSA
ncbi:MAG TPA: WD40 repeat domain-containing protein [Actinomycetota bacterium]|nr:WD40 repeat domain-containing protein [Actinomycetota bacterium]